jgi:hypothetical protein
MPEPVTRCIVGITPSDRTAVDIFLGESRVTLCLFFGKQAWHLTRSQSGWKCEPQRSARALRYQYTVIEQQKSRVRVSSSPPFQIKNLHEVLCFRLGTKRRKIGTGNRVCPGGAYVSCVFSRNKSATAASCALRFSVVIACV